ncbi:MAG: hypothetical protein IJQ28_04975, partial [Clostridia bacterium]|nr:hypothetical protein [Clostridia bacterium]
MNDKIGGSTDNITYTSSNRNIAYIEGYKFIPLRKGTVTVTASNSTESISRQVNINKFTEIEEVFSKYEGPDIYYPFEGIFNLKIHVAGDWWFVQGETGVLANKPYITFTSEGMQYNCSAGDVDLFYIKIPFLIYDADYSGLSNKYTIETNYKMSFVNAGFAIRFHIHNNNGNYYVILSYRRSENRKCVESAQSSKQNKQMYCK